MVPTARAAVAVALLSAWLVLLMAGSSFGGAIHLALVAALAAFPWREVRQAGADPAPGARWADEEEEKR